MKTQMMIAAALIALGAPALASAAPARTDDQPRQATVSYAGLDLNTPAGQASLKARLSAAARDVCGPEPDNRDLRASMDFHACRKMALKAALAAVPAPTEMAGSTGHKS